MGLRLYVCTNTTGLDLARHEIFRVSGIIESDKGVELGFDITFSPNGNCQYDTNTLKFLGISKENITDRQTSKEAFSKFLSYLKRFTDLSDPTEDRFTIFVYNEFTYHFFKKWFLANCATSFSSVFNTVVYVQSIAGVFASKRLTCPFSDFKMETVAKKLGFESSKTDSMKKVNVLYKITTFLLNRL